MAMSRAAPFRGFLLPSVAFCCLPWLPVALGGCATTSANVFLSANYDPAKIRRVAVIDFADFPGSPGSGQLVSSVFQTYVLALGYDFVERNQVEKILQEQNFQASGVVDPATEVRLGRLLGASDLIVGSLTEFSEASAQTVMEDVSQEQMNPIIGPMSNGQMGIVGYNSTFIPQSMPVTQTVPARVGMAVRLTGVQGGTVLWSASGIASASDVSAAAQDASSKIVRLLQKKLAALPGKP